MHEYTLTAPEKWQQPTALTRWQPRWKLGPALSPSGDISVRRFGPVVSPRGKHQASGARYESESAVSRLGSSTLAGGSSKEASLTAPEKKSNIGGANPSVASLGIRACHVPLWEPQTSALWAYGVLLKITRPRENELSPDPRFIASWSLSSLA